MAKKILEVKDLKVSFNTYAGEVQAVRGVDFHVNEGEILGIVGESGCGKSVTSNAIMRILPMNSAEYKSGEIFLNEGDKDGNATDVNNRDLLKISEDKMEHVRGNEISMIFQDSMSSLNPTMKIGKQISEAILRHNKDMKKEEANKIALDMLTAVGISTVEKRFKQYPHEFSGGMRQRAMIAMALTCNPKLLIADEPTTALDVTIQAQILSIMKKLATENGTSIILITHDLAVVAETCDRVVVMYAGQIIESATISNIFGNMKHPYTIGLMDSVPSMTMDQNQELTPIVGSPPDLIAPPKGCAFYMRCNQALKICEENVAPNIEFTEEDGTSHCVRCWLYSEEYKEHMNKGDK